MAIVANVCIQFFQGLVPLGLAFAGGAMFHVSIFELLLESVEDMGGWRPALVVVFLSAEAMFGLQHWCESILQVR